MFTIMSSLNIVNTGERSEGGTASVLVRRVITCTLVEVSGVNDGVGSSDDQLIIVESEFAL
jgi:hypothetical protein